MEINTTLETEMKCTDNYFGNEAGSG